MSLEIPEYKNQIKEYSELVKCYEQSDSLQKKEINLLSEHIEESHLVINEQMNTIDKVTKRSKLYKGLTIGGFSLSIVLLITLLIK